MDLDEKFQGLINNKKLEAKGSSAREKPKSRGRSGTRRNISDLDVRVQEPLGPKRKLPGAHQ